MDGLLPARCLDGQSSDVVVHAQIILIQLELSDDEQTEGVFVGQMAAEADRKHTETDLITSQLQLTIIFTVHTSDCCLD